MKPKISALTWTLLTLTFVTTVLTLILHEYLGAICGALLFLGTLWDIVRTHVDELASTIGDLDKRIVQWENKTESWNTHLQEWTTNNTSIQTTEDRLKRENEQLIHTLSEMARLDQSMQAVARLAQTSPILHEYLAWLRLRYGKLLELPISDGVIVAPDPDYFTFAAILLGNAAKNVRSTSLVDPHWYDSNECEKYIQDQRNNLIQQGKTFTRYFIVNPRGDTSARKTKTAAVIKNQVRDGFVIKVVHTTNYETEYDAAIIDDGRLWVRATVPTQNHQNLPGSITGCECYFQPNSVNRHIISQLDGYFAKLDSRARHTFGNGNMSAIDVQTIYA